MLMYVDVQQKCSNGRQEIQALRDTVSFYSSFLNLISLHLISDAPDSLCAEVLVPEINSVNSLLELCNRKVEKWNKQNWSAW